jgi:RNA-directed DNA polymerase
MLTALEEGVKGGKWYSLMDKVYAVDNLRMAFVKTKANKGGSGVDHITIEMFEENLEDNLARLTQSLKDGTYRPQAIKRVWIPKPGRKEKRPLGVPTVRDRVVQGAMRNVLEPIFERNFAEQSYGFRPNRGCKDALRRVDNLLKAGHEFVADVDLKSYFDSIPREALMERVEEKVTDGRILELVKAYLHQGVMDGVKEWEPESGTPQGAVISPLLSNIYLDPLDHEMARAGYEMVRYADDFVVLCRTREEAEAALEKVRSWTVKAGLNLHPEKTRIVDATQPGGFDFLGYHFEQGRKTPSQKNLRKFKDAIREKSSRTNGHSLQVVVENINRSTQGWYAYFKHSRKWVFRVMDGWIRMRLRSILRRRMHLRGRGRGDDHHRWPNAFFAEQGLFSLGEAHAMACQSALR